MTELQILESIKGLLRNSDSYNELTPNWRYQTETFLLNEKLLKLDTRQAIIFFGTLFAAKETGGPMCFHYPWVYLTQEVRSRINHLYLACIADQN